MADKPILFSAPMIRALLEGRKTMTRRVLKPQPAAEFISADIGQEAMAMKPAFLFGSETHRMLGRLPRPGDRLWVREAWHAARGLNATPPRDITRDSDIEHAATARSYAEIGLKGKLRPSMFMPRWASRLTLIVESVKVERLEDISRGDAMEEGCPFANMQAGPSPCDWFSNLWVSINGPGAWDANPWVVAISFRVIRANIDQLKEAA